VNVNKFIRHRSKSGLIQLCFELLKLLPHYTVSNGVKKGSSLLKRHFHVDVCTVQTLGILAT